MCIVKTRVSLLKLSMQELKEKSEKWLEWFPGLEYLHGVHGEWLAAPWAVMLIWQ